MGSKVFIFIGLLLAFVLLISSEVAARDLAETSADHKNDEVAAAETNGVEDAKYGGDYGNGGGNYRGGGGNNGGGNYRGGGGNNNGGGNYRGGGGNNNGGGNYQGGGGNRGGGGGRGNYCRYGCCGGRYNYGRGCRCCTYEETLGN